MFEALAEIHRRPEVFAGHTTADLWTDPHVSGRMLALHLDPDLAVASRTAAFIDRSVDWLAGRFALGPGTAVADFGCGPGLYTTRLARLGARVTGIDFSRRSLEHARRTAEAEGLDITYLQQDYLAFAPATRFDLVLLIMGDFCALDPGRRRRLLDTFRAALRPGGAVVLDVYSLHAYARRAEGASCGPDLMDGFWAPGPYFGFLNTFRYDAERVALDKYTIVEPHRVRTVYNWLQYYSPEALASELAGAGFAVAEWLADVAGSPFDPAADEFAVVARPDGPASR